MKVLITGTASGIGKGCAELFLKENHEVYGFDKNISSIQHPKYTHFCLDIRDKNSYPEIGQVDILINNAGVQNGDDIDVNLKGTISVTEHYGIHPNIYSVIMIGSASGHTGSEFPEYAASKGGVLAYTKNVAMRIAPYQATCNSLDFGGVMTELNRPVMEDEKLWDQIMELTPLKRWMSVDTAALQTAVQPRSSPIPGAPSAAAEAAHCLRSGMARSAPPAVVRRSMARLPAH